MVSVSCKIVNLSTLSAHLGFVGCLRDITMNGRKLDPRALIAMASVREISLDNCQLVDPCHRPNACEHGGLCNVDQGRVVCDCTGTGYTGKNCHFGNEVFVYFQDYFSPRFVQHCTRGPAKNSPFLATPKAAFTRLTSTGTDLIRLRMSAVNSSRTVGLGRPLSNITSLMTRYFTFQD